jgi:transmembrane sensor
MNGRRPKTEPGAQSSSTEGDIAKAAAEWRARFDAGIAAGEEESFIAWLEADVRHAKAFGEMDATWAILDRARDVPWETLEPEASVSPLPDAKLVRRNRGRSAWVAGTLAAAAAVAFLAGVWRHQGLEGHTEYANVAAAGPEVIQRVNLPDGSVVRLNSGTSVEIRFTERERRIGMEHGEASFAVAKDARRPFIVTTAGIDVRAVGTSFQVTSKSKSVEVLVTEGRVRVDDATEGKSLLAERPSDEPVRQPAALDAGEKVVISTLDSRSPNAALPVILPAAEIAKAVAWQERRLDFNSTPLFEIAAEFNRYNQHQLVIEDMAIRNQRFGGSFRADDPETFVRLLETRSDISIEQRADETIIRAAR